jgi:hypothetical protein
MFFFKKKSLTIDCFTAVEGAFKFAKPKHSAEFFPEWWKELPKTYTAKNGFWPSPTMRTCSGFIDLYKRGIMLSAWCDVAVKIGAKGTEQHYWQFSDQNYNAETHDYEQIGDQFNGKEFAHLKFTSPWFLKCNESVNWLWQDPTWNTLPNYDYKILPAVISYKWQHATNVNMIFRRKEETYTHHIKYKTPLVQLIPLTDNRKIKLEYHQVSDKEIGSLHKTRLKFTNNYQENIKRRGCPL